MNDQVTFLRVEEFPHPFESRITVTKRIYSAVTKQAAIDFLKTQYVSEQFYYIEIDTPSGRFGIDIAGKIYDNYGSFI